tara:strand:- start:914 stop:1447 length:534 start_codon:yes stop_codon:yes gene_type:complete
MVDSSYNPITNTLSNMLESDPQTFLRYIRKNELLTQEWISGECKNYHNWYSPAVHQLIILTGKLNTPAKEGEFFGSSMPWGIPEDLAIEIFRELTKYRICWDDTDYYGDNLERLLRRRHQLLTYRTGNEKLIQEVCHYFRLPDLSTIPEKKEKYAEPPVCSYPEPLPQEGPPTESNK